MKDCSIIVPTYNYAHLLERAVMSVIDSPSKYIYEILIDDDSSPDNAKEIMQKLRNKFPDKVIINFSNCNSGLSATRNRLLEISTGEYIFLLDADDVFVPNRIDKQIDYMKEHNLAHCYGGYQVISNSGKIEPRIIIPPDFDINYFLIGVNICYCGSNCFKKEVYNTIGGFDEDMKEGAEDFEYWLGIATHGFKQKCFPEVLYYLGVHSQNMNAKLTANGGFKRAYDYIKKKYPNLIFNF